MTTDERDTLRERIRESVELLMHDALGHRWVDDARVYGLAMACIDGLSGQLLTLLDSPVGEPPSKLAREVCYAIRHSTAFHGTKRERLARWVERVARLGAEVGEPEPDAWLVEVEDDEGWHRAAVRLDEVSARDTCKTWPYQPRVVPLYRRSKLPGAGMSEPPPDHATTVGSVEVDEPICERCGQRQPLVSMHFCGGKSGHERS